MGFYRSVARPLLFSLPPEGAHRLVGAALRLPFPWSSIGGADSSPALATDLCGIRIANPVGLAAGFDKNCSELRALGRLGFGYVVGGTVTRDPRQGNQKPRIIRRSGDESMVNSMGLPNDGVEAVAARMGRLGKRASAVLVSLADEDVDDIVENYRILEPLVDGFELNVSSPNSPFRHGRDDRQNEDHLRKALSVLAGEDRKPIFVKLPPFSEAAERDSVLGLAEIAAEGGADGLTCSNTRPETEPRLADGAGGLSGRPLFADTPSIVDLVRRTFGLPVNACGGIFSAEDARACLDAGAVTVQIYTAFIYEGPRVVRRITTGLARPLAASDGPVQDG